MSQRLKGILLKPGQRFNRLVVRVFELHDEPDGTLSLRSSSHKLVGGQKEKSIVLDSVLSVSRLESADDAEGLVRKSGALKQLKDAYNQEVPGSKKKFRIKLAPPKKERGSPASPKSRDITIMAGNDAALLELHSRICSRVSDTQGPGGPQLGVSAVSERGRSFGGYGEVTENSDVEGEGRSRAASRFPEDHMDLDGGAGGGEEDGMDEELRMAASQEGAAAGSGSPGGAAAAAAAGGAAAISVAAASAGGAGGAEGPPPEIKGRLSVKVVRAEGVRAADTGWLQSGKSDPYVKVFFPTSLGNLSMKKSEVCNKSLDPVWNFECEEHIAWGEGERPPTDLLLEVWDWDLVSAHDFLGQVRVPLHDVIVSRKRHPGETLGFEGKSFSLQGREGPQDEKEKPTGRIVLDVLWDPHSPELVTPHDNPVPEEAEVQAIEMGVAAPIGRRHAPTPQLPQDMAEEGGEYPKQGDLIVNVISASDLRAADAAGFFTKANSDPFVKVTVPVGVENAYDWETPYLPKTLNPNWQESVPGKNHKSFRLRLNEKGLKMRFEVFDYDALSAPDFLGMAEVAIPEDKEGQVQTLTLPLQPKEGEQPEKETEKVTGSLLVEVEWKEARTAKSRSGTRASQDAAESMRTQLERVAAAAKIENMKNADGTHGVLIVRLSGPLSLRVCVRPPNQMYVPSFSLIRARQLVAKDFNLFGPGSSDPYGAVRLRTGPGKTDITELHTGYERRTLNPDWAAAAARKASSGKGEEGDEDNVLRFRVDYRKPKNPRKGAKGGALSPTSDSGEINKPDTILVELWDYDFGKDKGDFLGETELEVPWDRPAEPVEKTSMLGPNSAKDKQRKEHVTGNVTVEIEWHPDTGGGGGGESDGSDDEDGEDVSLPSSPSGGLRRQVGTGQALPAYLQVTQRLHSFLPMGVPAPIQDPLQAVKEREGGKPRYWDRDPSTFTDSALGFQEGLPLPSEPPTLCHWQQVGIPDSKRKTIRLPSSANIEREASTQSANSSPTSSPSKLKEKEKAPVLEAPTEGAEGGDKDKEKEKEKVVELPKDWIGRAKEVLIERRRVDVELLRSMSRPTFHMCRMVSLFLAFYVAWFCGAVGSVIGFTIPLLVIGVGGALLLVNAADVHVEKFYLDRRQKGVEVAICFFQKAVAAAGLGSLFPPSGGKEGRGGFNKRKSKSGLLKSGVSMAELEEEEEDEEFIKEDQEEEVKAAEINRLQGPVFLENIFIRGANQAQPSFSKTEFICKLLARLWNVIVVDVDRQIAAAVPSSALPLIRAVTLGSKPPSVVAMQAYRTPKFIALDLDFRWMSGFILSTAVGGIRDIFVEVFLRLELSNMIEEDPFVGKIKVQLLRKPVLHIQPFGLFCLLLPLTALVEAALTSLVYKLFGWPKAAPSVFLVPPALLKEKTVTGYLQLQIVRGRSLPPKDSKFLGMGQGTSDPYVKVRVSDLMTEKTSNVIKKTLNPEWNEEVLTLGPVRDPWRKTVYIRVFDKDQPPNPDDLLGVTEMWLGSRLAREGSSSSSSGAKEDLSLSEARSKQLGPRVPLNVWSDEIELSLIAPECFDNEESRDPERFFPPPPGKIAKTVEEEIDVETECLRDWPGGGRRNIIFQGKLTVKFKFALQNDFAEEGHADAAGSDAGDGPEAAANAQWLQQPGNLNVTVHGASNLRAADANGKSDPYAVLSLLDDGAEGVTAQQRKPEKTRIIKKTLDPAWEQTFVFSVAALQDAKLNVLVKDSDFLSKDDLLGTVTLDCKELVKGKYKNGVALEDTEGTNSILRISATFTEKKWD
uniref:C2 domain-containing protein n=1 Tax=Chromera velia CCMP2878 TaxID=1169474 RepID=A0A0G4IB22_9ALVE|eukprot:Cvel_12706.t1-p1 / transcript=Cvel_12706.t1 / gene=Cvel_12706 / organism=Chromera_velia_CCMP2878 / gene_product=Synaptotagmin-2, putative / transcript_product=Synaptotagmin-2, putative / location=Cvel_scaffold843:1260-17711(-) / protein_length=1783 / sequence_SO=supercontig / SO=protein_coding / is_pseudo=false